jgi:PleD family two-component response regulator
MPVGILQGHPGRRAVSPVGRDEAILLVEDAADDELLTRRTLKKNNIRNEVVVARDGAEALDYPWGASGPTSAPGSCPW